MNLLLSLRDRVHSTAAIIAMDVTSEEIEMYRRAPSETPDAVLIIPRARIHLTAGTTGRGSVRVGDILNVREI